MCRAGDGVRSEAFGGAGVVGAWGVGRSAVNGEVVREGAVWEGVRGEGGAGVVRLGGVCRVGLGGAVVEGGGTAEGESPAEGGGTAGDGVAAEGESPARDGVAAEGSGTAGVRGPPEGGSAAGDGLAAWAAVVRATVVGGVAGEGAGAEKACGAGVGPGADALGARLR